MRGVMGMLAVVAGRRMVRVRGVGWMLVVLRVGGRVVVVVVVVRRGVLGNLAVLRMVNRTLVLGLYRVGRLRRVVQVGGVGLVGY